MKDTNTESIEKKSGHGAKEISLLSMVISAIWVGSLSLLKGFWGLLSAKAFGLTMNEIVLSGIIMAAIFSPVYLNLILEKIRDIKIG